MQKYSSGTKILYSPSEVNQLLESKQIFLIDIREPEDYQHSHIPGAINLTDFFYYLSTSTRQGLEELQVKFSTLLSNAGIDNSRKIIFYENNLDSRFGSSCRGYWITRYLGHHDTGILYGGYDAWLKHNYPTTDQQQYYPGAEFSLNPQHNIMATKKEILEAINNPEIIFLDNRDKEEWLGKSSSPYGVDFAPRKGRIPGARWIEWYSFMNRSSSLPSFKAINDIKSLCAEAEIYPESDLIIYCFKGSRAANSYVILKEAGFSKLRLYLGSWNEWSRDPELPIESP
jgi:thiosulfate/3-mercaptopyruvate sulfurtransferase